MDAVQIDFDEIKQGDRIRTLRSNDSISIVLEGVAEKEDMDGDWICGDELLTYRDGDYEESYFLVNSGSLPEETGTLVTWQSQRNQPVYALKVPVEGKWFLSFADGSADYFDSLHVARKDWTRLN